MSASQLQLWMVWDLDGGIIVRVDPDGVRVELICAETQRRVASHCDLRAYLGESGGHGPIPLRQTVARRLPADHSIDVELAVRSRIARTDCA